MNGYKVGTKIEEPEKNGICDSSVASIVRGPLMKVGYTQFLIKDDVMAIYHGPGR